MGFASQSERIERDLTLHPPVSPLIGAHMDNLRAHVKELAHFIDEAVPNGREKSQALSALELCGFHAIAGVARDQDAVLAELAP